MQTVFTKDACIECDACVDICPMDCITFTENGEEADLRQRLKRPGRQLGPRTSMSPDGLKTGRVMVKDEDVCLHCGLCAERCPTGAWDMQKFLLEMTHAGTHADSASPISVNDFVVRFANVNGSGSASANEMFARAIMRMGVPVAPRNIFPSNIQGLPTWYEVRVSEKGYLGRRGGLDMMVAMNPQTWDKDVAGIEPGGYLFYDSTKPDAAVEVPRRHHRHRHAADRNLQRAIYRSAPAPAVQEHHLCRRAVGPARHGRQGDRDAHQASSTRARTS